MVIWLLLILFVSLWNVRFCNDGFYSDYLGKEQSNAVKGLFIMLVFFRHVITIIKRCGFGFELEVDRMAKLFNEQMGQLVVALFLFYSGYGVMKSLLTKGEYYLETYPKRRLLTTLLNYDVAVCFFLLLGWIIGRPMNFSNILLSFIAWDNLGNSNWYIFVILCCYLVFYLVFKVVRSRYLLGALLITILVFFVMLALHRVKVPYWYTTILVFPVGIFYALFSNRLEEIIQKRYWLSLTVLILAFLLLHLGHFRPLHGLTENFKAIVFALLVVIFTMKVRLCNKWLIWCGISLFPLYIYQRIPMIAIRSGAGDSWVCANPNLYFGICFVVTVGITLLYNNYLQIHFNEDKGTVRTTVSS